MSAEFLELPGTGWSESDRLRAIEEYEILDTPREDEYQDMVKLAAQMCHAPMAMVSIVAKDRQWFKAEVGLEVRETPLAESICKYTIQQPGLLVIPDIAQDPRFLDHPLVIGENPVRFYAGAPLETPAGLPIGAMCILDNKPRELSEPEAFTLKALARQVMIQLELRRLLRVKSKSEDRLRASELSYRRLFEAAQDGILILDVETGRIEDVNPFLIHLLGFPRSEMVGKTVGEMSPFKDVVSNEEMLGLLKKDGYVRYEHLPLETKDGRRIAVEFVSNVYQAGDKKVIQCNIRDITKQKRAEMALRESEEQFRNMFTAAATGIAISTPEGRFLRANGAYCKMLGYTEEELRELNFAALTHPADIGLNVKMRDEILSGQRENFFMEKRYLKKNGDIVWTRHSVSATHTTEGEITNLTVVAEDITERKRSEARFRLLVDSNAQGVFFWNMKGEISGANDAFLRISRQTREDLEAGRLSWTALTPPEYAPLDRLALEELAQTRVCTPYEKEYLLKDGSRVPVLVGAAMFEDDPTQGVCFVIDITERKKLEQQFLRAQRMESIGTLAGGIAHDLNNILAPIMMAIELLKGSSESPQARAILETIEVSAKRGADIVGQVLSFARGMDGERIEVQPKHLLQDMETIIKDTFPKNILREFSVSNDLWKILGDPTQLHQILLNLCVNARDAMPEGGKLTVEVENVVLDQQYAAMHILAKAGKYVCISVTDSGTGIPPAILEKIFEPFFTTKEVGKGTGLGLSTVTAIVKSHGGFINAYSEPGSGTTFRVHLPAADVAFDEWSETPAPAALPRGNGETILLVDDEASILTITSQTLEAFGYRILTAADGAEAVGLYALHRDKIAVVLTDMAMPVLDGVATIRALTKINPAIKIIAASGLNSNGGPTKVSGGGVKHFLTKPYTAGTLLNAVRAILDET
jgi:PAS domain S-box-containing protein